MLRRALVIGFILVLLGGVAYWWRVRGSAPQAAPVVVSAPSPASVAPPAARPGLIRGVGASSDLEDADALRARLEGRLPAVLELGDEVDVSNHYRCSDERFAFVIGKPSRVTLTLHTPEPHVVLDADLAAGAHRVDIALGHAPFGDFAYELAARQADGTNQTHSATLRHTIRRSDPMPLAHTFVKDTDLFDGHLVVSSSDVKFGVREPVADFTRTYSSNSGSESGVLGRGWSSTADEHVRADACGQVMVLGAMGQAQRFARVTGADGVSQFQTLYGYHSVLLSTADGFDVYSKNGTRLHYAERIGASWYLSYIEAPNGERLVRAYADVDGQRRVTSIRDSAGRELKLGYSRVAVREPGLDGPEAVRLTSIDGPLGLHVDYSYDAEGDLQRVKIGDASRLGDSITEYVYEDFGSPALPEATPPRLQHVGRKLVQVRDTLAASARTFRYKPDVVAMSKDDVRLRHVQLRIVAVTEPDGGETRFEAQGTAGDDVVSTIVTTAMGAKVTYEMNAFGMGETTRTPAGTTRREWDMASYQVARTIDGDGIITEETYDAHGNRTRQLITHPDGGSVERRWTFVPAGKFARPYVRERQASYTDGRGLETRFEYDPKVHLIKLTRGKFSELRGYADNGDIMTRHNSDGESWEYAYDSWGHQISSKDADGVVKRSQYDALDRKIADIDAAGIRTESSFDARDREVTRTPSLDPASEDPVTIAYDDKQRTATRTDRHGKKIVISYDAMWRKVKIVDGDGRVWSARYDFDGNTLQEIDFSRAITAYEYDGDDRVTKKTAPDGTVTVYSYDATGYVTSERTRNAEGVQQLTENRYEHPLRKLTWQRVRVGERKPETWQQGFDGNGNRVRLQTPDGKITEFRFDAFDRQIDANEQISL